MSTGIDAIESREFLGIRVHSATMQEVLSCCDRAAAGHDRLVLGVLNAAKIVKMGQDEALRDAVLSADLILPDGMAVVWASRILREPLPERVPGIDLFERLLGVAERSGHSVYFLGATDEVLSNMMEAVRRRHPSLEIAGFRNGYFGAEEESSIVAEINAVRPGFLFVGISTPKKEKFLADWGDRLEVGVCHGVGGSFDILAGKVERAPQWMQNLGLEWFYRVVQEPRRMWKRYLVTNTLFLAMLTRELLGSRRRP
jgi:N-acetylglucosaminyldiphosphoundecaprenol N-acetyl-beta-D-mannosaminyltransferase